MSVSSDNQPSANLESFFNRVVLGNGAIASYYKMVKVFSDVMRLNNIEFFAHSGTMLGCVRHRGIIPWDDDVDVMVEECFEERLVACVPELEKHGVCLKKDCLKGLYQFYVTRKTNKDICPANLYLQIDVFIGRREVIDGELVLHYKADYFRKTFSKRYIEVADLYPLREYQFGPLTIMGIGNYEGYFSRSGFKTDAAIVMRHMNFEHFLPEIEVLKSQGVYPIVDPKYLHWRHEIPYKEVDIPSVEKPPQTVGKKIVLTYGTFDLFHVGHVNILKRLREMGDALYVGLSSDEFNAGKGKKSFYSYEERKQILMASKYVDYVFPENTWEQKSEDIIKYNISIFGMGDDWRGKFDELNSLCEVVYLDRTENISTTDVKNALSGISKEKIQSLEESLHSSLELVLNLAASVGAKKT